MDNLKHTSNTVEAIVDDLLDKDLKDRVDAGQIRYDRNVKICTIIDINKLHKLLNKRIITVEEFDYLWDMTDNRELFAVFNKLHAHYMFGNPGRKADIYMR